jgi:hypothetical protein
MYREYIDMPCHANAAFYTAVTEVTTPLDYSNHIRCKFYPGTTDTNSFIKMYGFHTNTKNVAGAEDWEFKFPHICFDDNNEDTYTLRSDSPHSTFAY